VIYADRCALILTVPGGADADADADADAVQDRCFNLTVAVNVE